MYSTYSAPCVSLAIASKETNGRHRGHAAGKKAKRKKEKLGLQQYGVVSRKTRGGARALGADLPAAQIFSAQL